MCQTITYLCDCYYGVCIHFVYYRNTVDSLQKVMNQMEQDQAMLGKKVHRLQESLKSYKLVRIMLYIPVCDITCVVVMFDVYCYCCCCRTQEAEQSKEKSGELEKKLSKVKYGVFVCTYICVCINHQCICIYVY